MAHVLPAAAPAALAAAREPDAAAVEGLCRAVRRGTGLSVFGIDVVVEAGRARECARPVIADVGRVRGEISLSLTEDLP
jgi:hypothetical protein